MLRSLVFRPGSAEHAAPLEIRPGPMTVFVGPNNSGKSLALREIESFLERGGECENRIIAGMELSLPAAAEAERMLETRRIASGEAAPDGWMRVSRMKPMSEYVKKRATDVDEGPDDQLVDFQTMARLLEGEDPPAGEEMGRLCREFLSLFSLRLDGQTRLALTHPRPTGDLQLHPANHLAALICNPAARERNREITADAFGMYFVIDPTEVGQLRIRMARRAPHDEAEEQALDARARSFHASASDIAELSDGIKAFTGLTAAVLSADYRLMLIDEPEAFLHPPLTRKLGKRLTQLATERAANVVAATHSPDFLMGCVHSGRRVNIVRLTYRQGVASATHLKAEKLQLMMRDPLLRSTGVLSALFHEGAIVCEADADRVFYQEVNERLLGARRDGADGCIFLNAQNKQTIRRIIRPLREMGIPAAAVVDLDLLKGKDDFRDLLDAAFAPRVYVSEWERLRSLLHQKLRNEDFKTGGIFTLPRDVRDPVEELLEALGRYGVFIVPGGELECWMPQLEAGGHGPEWLTQIFERMGTDPATAEYVRPGEGDVWGFMERISRWIGDPHRKGMGEERVRVERLLRPVEAAPAPVCPGAPAESAA